MYTPILIVTLPAFFSGIRALSLPVSTLEYQLPSSPIANLTANYDPVTNQSSNSTTNSLTFLGVDCYHLLPDTVDLLMCQNAFADLYRGGHVYEEVSLYNGWFYRTQRDPCTIKIANRSKQERHDRVSISVADIVSYATEVLEECQTGGANTFKGNWQVVVTRNPVNELNSKNGLDEQ